MKMLLPLMFFFAFSANTHLEEKIAWEVAYAYLAVISFLFWLSYIILAFIPVLKHEKGMHAANLISNHLMLVSAPVAGLLLGIDAMPIIVLGMLGQFWFILLSVLTGRKGWHTIFEIIGRYYGKTLWIWACVVLGILSSHMPWNNDVTQFFSESFDWLCLFNTLFASIVMAGKSCSVDHSLKESGVMYLSKTVLICLILNQLMLYADFDEAQLSLFAIMFFSPGIMIKSSSISTLDVSQYWKQMIAGCNIWYMITMVVVILLPQLLV